jgi:hypothetical protein
MWTDSAVRISLIPGAIEEAPGTGFYGSVLHCVELDLIARIYLQPYRLPLHTERTQSEVQRQVTAEIGRSASVEVALSSFLLFPGRQNHGSASL